MSNPTHDQWKGRGEMVAVAMFASLLGFLVWERWRK